MPDYFFARQGVLDGSKAVFGYELLFRSDYQNSCRATNGDQATLEVLSNALFHTTFEQMVGGKHGLVNFTQELLFSDVAFLFSPEHLIIEVLETVVPDDNVVEACKRFKTAGYKIALDDFTVNDLGNPLLRLADFVKVDFLLAKGNDRKLISQRLTPLDITLLAEKVESDADYREGLSLGYKLFQGYFFSKPIIRMGHKLEANQISCVRMLQAVSKDTLDYGEINGILKTDMSLSYRMLKLANSPFFGFRSEITSILHAITLLGSQGVKRFVSLIALSATTEGKPSELALISLTRARMGEEIAASAGFQTEASALFITGLFSMLDAMLDCTMEEAVDQLPISQDIKTALLGEKNKLRNLLDVIISYEKGDWAAFSEAATLAGVKEDTVPAVYTAAISWANEVYQSM